MSSPAFGYASWGRRRSSISSQASHEEEHPANSNDARQLSSSVGSASHREPIRSFIHGTVRERLAPLDSAQSARSVREDTAELATYFLSDKKDSRETPFLRRSRSTSSPGARYAADHHRGSDASPVRPAETITEVPEPPSPPTDEPTVEGPSMLTNMFRRSPPGNSYFYSPSEGRGHDNLVSAEESGTEDEATLSKIPTAESRPL